MAPVNQFLFFLLLIVAGRASAEEKVNAVEDIAMDGFDVVAYFNQKNH
jgi:hypothetical protein